METIDKKKQKLIGMVRNLQTKRCIIKDNLDLLLRNEQNEEVMQQVAQLTEDLKFVDRSIVEIKAEIHKLVDLELGLQCYYGVEITIPKERMKSFCRGKIRSTLLEIVDHGAVITIDFIVEILFIFEKLGLQLALMNQFDASKDKIIIRLLFNNEALFNNQYNKQELINMFCAKLLMTRDKAENDRQHRIAEQIKYVTLAEKDTFHYTIIAYKLIKEESINKLDEVIDLEPEPKKLKPELEDSSLKLELGEIEAKETKGPSKLGISMEVDTFPIQVMPAEIITGKLYDILESMGMTIIKPSPATQTGLSRIFINLKFNDPWECQKAHDMIAEYQVRVPQQGIVIAWIRYTGRARGYIAHVRYN